MITYLIELLENSPSHEKKTFRWERSWFAGAQSRTSVAVRNCMGAVNAQLMLCTKYFALLLHDVPWLKVIFKICFIMELPRSLQPEPRKAKTFLTYFESSFRFKRYFSVTRWDESSCIPRPDYKVQTRQKGLCLIRKFFLGWFIYHLTDAAA